MRDLQGVDVPGQREIIYSASVDVKKSRLKSGARFDAEVTALAVELLQDIKSPLCVALVRAMQGKAEPRVVIRVEHTPIPHYYAVEAKEGEENTQP